MNNEPTNSEVIEAWEKMINGRIHPFGAVEFARHFYRLGKEQREKECLETAKRNLSEQAIENHHALFLKDEKIAALEAWKENALGQMLEYQKKIDRLEERLAKNEQQRNEMIVAYDAAVSIIEQMKSAKPARSENYQRILREARELGDEKEKLILDNLIYLYKENHSEQPKQVRK